MRKLNFVIAMLIAGLMFIQTSCKKDKDKEDQPSTEIKLVVVKRNTGDLYTVDTITGTLTQIGSLTINGEPLTGLRGLVYDSSTELCYAGATSQGGRGFYSINIKTGVATLLNDDANGDWDGIADLILLPDGNIMANLYSNHVDIYNSALVSFDKFTGEDGTHYSISDGVDDIWSPGGLTYGSSATQVIIGGGDMNLYFGNVTGMVSDTLALIPSANIQDESTYVMDLETDVYGTVFAMLYEYSDEAQHLVKLNISTGEITEMSVLSSTGISNGYHCLAFVPEVRLP